jgi:23S rRNA (cytosine1962-C5)-methyltransferase
MFTDAQYQLLDFGDGRKLERFGSYVLDRPAPAADTAPRSPQLWSAADARYQRTTGDQGTWTERGELAATWYIRWRQVVLELKRTDFGHLGVFPEHASSWQWLGDLAQRAGRPLKVLNLFAYTGGATLALAAAGAEVVHVDSARNTVSWARRNAEHSSLAAAPIRWIVEDARKFVQRELRRGNRYDAVVLDPPTYGHGPQGEAWKFDQHVGSLVRDCLSLIGHPPAREAAANGATKFVLLTCHTPGFERSEIESLLAPIAQSTVGRLSVEPLELISAAGNRLPCGVEARWMAQAD